MDEGKKLVKMLRNVNVRRCCLDLFEDFEISQAEDIGNGIKRFKEGCMYTLGSERAYDWDNSGFCVFWTGVDYVY